MKYLYAFILAILVYPSQLLAQRNFKPGYIVSLKGDTTKGFVDYRDWNINPRQFAFKAQENANIDQYSTQTIAAFGVSKLEGYTRYAGPVSVASVEIAKLINNRDTRVKQDTVFLRFVTAGKHLSLFEYTDEVKQRFFIADGAAAPVELNFYKYFNQKNNGIITDNTFQQQLLRLAANYLAGNQKIIPKIQKAEYRLADVEKIVSAINGAESNKVASRSEAVFFGGLAANITSTSYNVGNGSNTSVLPQLNAGVNFVLNRNVRAFIIRAELNITGSKADISTSAGIIGGSLRTTFNKFILSFAPQAIYNVYNTEKVKAFIGAGIAINYHATSNQKSYLDKLEVKYEPTSNADFSTVLKAGVSFKKFEIYAGYSKPIEDYAVVSIRSRSYQVGLNYFFK